MNIYPHLHSDSPNYDGSDQVMLWSTNWPRMATLARERVLAKPLIQMDERVLSPLRGFGLLVEG